MSVNDFVNTSMLFEPYNWLIVVLMLALAIFVLHALADPLDQIGALTQAV